MAKRKLTRDEMYYNLVALGEEIITQKYGVDALTGIGSAGASAIYGGLEGLKKAKRLKAIQIRSSLLKGGKRILNPKKDHVSKFMKRVNKY